MQGIETASLANDACGVPLPWLMTNPWLFFDGKLFHLKLKMSTYVQNLRELCDDHIEIVLKVNFFWFGFCLNLAQIEVFLSKIILQRAFWNKIN